MKEKNFYANPLEYIKDELKKLDLILARATLLHRNKKRGEKDIFSGLFISQEEIDMLLREDKYIDDDSAEAAELERDIERQGLVIRNKLINSGDKETFIPMEYLRKKFEITDLDADILVICLAPHLDAKYEKIYAYLLDDVTKKYATIQLIFLLMTASLQERVHIRERLSPYSPLIQWELISSGNGKNELSVATASGYLSIDKRILDFLMGSKNLDYATAGILQFIEPEVEIDKLYLKDKFKSKLKNIAINLQRSKEDSKNTVIFICGPYGVGKKKTSSAISNYLKIPLLELNVGVLLRNEDMFFSLFNRAIREAVLIDCCFLIKDFQILLSEDRKFKYFRDHMIKEISKLSFLTFITSEKNGEFPEENNARYIKVHLPLPDHTMRRRIWEEVLNEADTFSLRLTAYELADKFKFSEGQIRGALSIARDRTLLRSQKDDCVTDEDLLTGCRAQSNQKLTEMAFKITPRYVWSDIVLPSDQKEQLEEICNQFKYWSKVYDEWGFYKKISLGKGLNVLFSGPPGTGKTMGAEVIAYELKLEIFKIDLSQVVSKYIGETEKNLNRIFTEAEASNAILFFDEADALFGKRSEVKDSHDRYANIEISYLLQKMEEYEGITILATNLRQNMDEAFIRRIQFIVDFPIPDERHRYKIWRVHFPAEAPVSEDIDFDFLAGKIKLPGGNIKNIVMNAAFLAASNEWIICMEHLIHATKREFQKMGKLCVRGDFGKYDPLIEESVIHE